MRGSVSSLMSAVLSCDVLCVDPQGSKRVVPRGKPCVGRRVRARGGGAVSERVSRSVGWTDRPVSRRKGSLLP